MWWALPPWQISVLLKEQRGSVSSMWGVEGLSWFVSYIVPEWEGAVKALVHEYYMVRLSCRLSPPQ